MKIICHRAQIFVTVQLKDFFNTSQCCVVLYCGGQGCAFYVYPVVLSCFISTVSACTVDIICWII